MSKSLYIVIQVVTQDFRLLIRISRVASGFKITTWHSLELVHALIRRAQRTLSNLNILSRVQRVLQRVLTSRSIYSKVVLVRLSRYTFQYIILFYLASYTLQKSSPSNAYLKDLIIVLKVVISLYLKKQSRVGPFNISLRALQQSSLDRLTILQVFLKILTL